VSVTVTASLVIAYAVLQTVVILLLFRFVDLYEREPLTILGLMVLWGAIGATALSAIGNEGLRALLPEDVALVFGRAIYAPVVEEIAKGLALVVFVAVSLVARGRYGIPRFDGLTDGLVYGAAIGLGFAFTEDLLYLLVRASDEGLEQGLDAYLSRRNFFGIGMLRHAIYTGVFGAGLGLATWSLRRTAKLLLPVMGLLGAMVLHAFHNGWVSFALVRQLGFDATVLYAQGVSGAAPAARQIERDAAETLRAFDLVLFAAFAAAILVWLSYQRRVIRHELQEEAEQGLITDTELDLMPLYWRRTLWYWELVRTGQWERLRLLKRMHNELVDLALLKRRTRRGKRDPAEVQRSRRLIAKLKAQKAVFL